MTMNEEMGLETILNDIHGNGLLHVVLLMTCAMTSFLSGLELQSVIFMNYKPPFNCSDEAILNGTNITWVSYAVYQKVLNGETAYLNNTTPATEQCWGILHYSEINEPYTCKNWVYDKSQMKRTVVTQFNLVCDRQSWIPWMASAYLFSIAVGYLLSSTSDFVGRKRLMIIFAFFEIIVCIVTPFSISPAMLLVLRCFRGLSVTISYFGITLISELSPIKLRAMYGNLYWVLWSVGYMTAAALAYGSADWIYLRLWSCTFFVVYLTFPFIVCESPRWLCSRGENEEALKTLKQIAHWNGAKLPSDYFMVVRKFLDDQHAKNGYALIMSNGAEEQSKFLPNTEPQKKDRFIDIIFLPRLRNRTLIFILVHSTMAIVYFGLATDSTFASANIFLNVFLMGLVELPSSFVGWMTSVNLGRRKSMMMLFTFTAASVMAATFLRFVQPIAQSAAAIIGKLSISVAYLIEFLYIAECYPTSIRGSCFFCIVTLANFSSSIAPFVNELSKVAYYIPAILYAALCTFSVISVYFVLPETRLCPLAQTVKESEQLICGKEEIWIKSMNKSIKLDINEQTVE